MGSFVLGVWKKIRWVPGVFSLSSLLYSRRFAELPPSHSPKFGTVNSSRRLCIVSPERDLSSSFRPVQGNYSFELVHSAKERYGEESVYSWSEEELHRNPSSFVEFIQKRGITHVVLCPESPESPETWALPAVLSEVSKEVSVTFWFYLLDSVHWDHMFKLNHLSRFVGEYFALAIDRSISSRLREVRRACEPSCLPISSSTLSKLPAVSADFSLCSGVSFLGSLYGYREKALDGLKTGLLEVNPHRKGDTMPSYETYLLALRNSKATVNFSRASSYNLSQLKSRVLEAGVVGCPVVSDDNGKGSRFLGSESLTFTVSRWGGIRRFLTDATSQEKLEVFDRQKLLERSRELAPKTFWESFENAELAWFSSK